MSVPELSKVFPSYKEFSPAVPVYRATQGLDGCIHRFYDSSPFSPSGRYLALTRFPAEDIAPSPGTKAEVFVIDLETGGNIKAGDTAAWDTQLGAQVQWGSDDTKLFYNDLASGEWKPYAIKINPLTGEKKKIRKPVFHISADGKKAASICLARTGITQKGYGIRIPGEFIPQNNGAPADDGVSIVNLEDGIEENFISLAEIVQKAVPEINSDLRTNGNFYVMHVKWNPQGNRLMLVLRCPTETGWNPMMLTMKPEGGEICLTVKPEQWANGGNHPNWMPDGKHVFMNLSMKKNSPRRFYSCRYDGSEGKILTEAEANRGHPSLHPSGKFIITDAYAHEVFDDGTSPLLLFDLNTKKEKITLARVAADPAFTGTKNEMRLDLHPAFDRSFQYVAFNGLHNGKRNVFIADIRTFL